MAQNHLNKAKTGSRKGTTEIEELCLCDRLR